MKTYALENISSCEQAAAELRQRLPGEQAPWLLKASDGDVIAYFNVIPKRVGSEWRGSCVTADISGRHFNEDAAVIAVLRHLQSLIGGDLTDDSGNVIRPF
ncbi:MAG TPA: hypothetical protein VFY05_11560 [Candidatus Angelobacter sp.]|nr:hypothetical protein [Candidatus Angelobacter sp.]